MSRYWRQVHTPGEASQPPVGPSVNFTENSRHSSSRLSTEESELLEMDAVEDTQRPVDTSLNVTQK